MESALGPRVSVRGTSGAGKTTLAAELNYRLGLPHVELDTLARPDDGSFVPVEKFRAEVARLAAASRWVIDGNLSGT